MNIPAWLQWALKQGLGKNRGGLVISLLSGPVGVALDIASKGQVGEALRKSEDAVDAVRKVIGG